MADALYAAAFSERAVSFDGTVLSYARIGQGPPAVVCHGSFATGADWFPFAQHLGRSRTVYLYDRRGRAGSPLVAEDFALEAEVDDLAVMVQLAGPGAAVLGHSFGGGCALSFAARGGFGGALVLYEPRHSILSRVSRGYADDVDRIAATGDREAAMMCVLANVVGMASDVIERFRASPLWDKMCATVDAFGKEVRLLDSLRWRWGDLDRIDGPIHLLIGEKSHQTEDEAAADAALKALLPKARTVTIPHEGHFAYMTAPEALAAIIEASLDA